MDIISWVEGVLQKLSADLLKPLVLAVGAAMIAWARSRDWHGATPLLDALVAGVCLYVLIYGFSPQAVSSLGWWIMGCVFIGALVLFLYEDRKSNRRRVPFSLEPEKTTSAGLGNNILGPPSRDPVSHRQTVSGELVVQVFIFSGDQKWWPQPPLTVKWSGVCTLGNLDSPAGSPYRIVAVIGGQPLPPGIPVSTESLPSGVARSQEVQVFHK
jgi:hypothetical protein